MAGTALVFCGLGLGLENAFGEDAGDGVAGNAETIHQEPVFSANRKRVYEALMEAAQFQKVTMLSEAARTQLVPLTKATEIGSGVGDAFALYGGYITGRHLELIPGERIVQAWRAGSWDSGAYSIAHFQLMEHEGGTKIVFDHLGFPKGLGHHLAAGWKGNYWEPLAKYLG